MSAPDPWSYCACLGAFHDAGCAEYVADPPSPSPLCLECQRELCQALDAYYGTDDYWSRFCSPCRDVRLARKAS